MSRDSRPRMPGRARPSEVASAAVSTRWTPEGRARTALKALRDPAVRAVVPLTLQQRDLLQQLATVALANLDD